MSPDPLSRAVRAIGPLALIVTSAYLAQRASLLKSSEAVLFAGPLLVYGSYIGACLTDSKGWSLTVRLCLASLVFASFGLCAGGHIGFGIAVLASAVVTYALRLKADSSPVNKRLLTERLSAVDQVLGALMCIFAMCTIHFGIWLIDESNMLVYLAGSFALYFGGSHLYNKRKIGHVLIALGGIAALVVFGTSIAVEFSTVISLFVSYQLMRWRWKCKDRFDLEQIIPTPPPIIAHQATDRLHHGQPLSQAARPDRTHESTAVLASHFHQVQRSLERHKSRL